MLTLEQVLALLFDTVRGNKRHLDYKHVTELAELYEQLITGKNISKLLKRFVRRESDVEFKERVLLTQQICPAWAESIMTPFYLVGRLDNVRRAINFKEGSVGADTKREEIEEMIADFYGNESLEEYLATRFVELSFSDPNAFIAIEFDAFDNIIEKAKPYPVEFSSSEAVNFAYRNNKLQWVIFKEQQIDKRAPDGTKRKADAYRIYSAQFAVRIEQVFEFEGKLSGVVSDDISSGYWVQDSSKIFAVTIAEPGANEIQVMRVGYKSDLRTKGRTKVNPFHAAVKYFKKSIKLVSESDLSDSLHAFPQKEMLIEPCEGNPIKDLTCTRGFDQNGKVCKGCRGLGYKVPKSAQDAIYIPWPKPNETNPVKPGEVVRYAQLPVELLRYQNDKIDALEIKAKRAVYNAESLVKTTISDSATEVNVRQNEKNNTLYPFAKNSAKFWKFDVRITAALTDNAEGLEEVCEYPKDLKMMTQDEILAALKAAADSGAPSFFIQSLQRDLARKINEGDNYAFLKIVVKERFTPFIGKTPEEIMYILSSGMARIEDQVLWTHSDTIFDDLDYKNPGFFSFTYEKQWDLINEQVKLIAAALPKLSTALNIDVTA